MLYAISWFLVLVLFATWSAGIWVAHSLAVWSLTTFGAMVGHSPQIDRLPIPDWVALWIPADTIVSLKASAAAVLPWIESSLSALPSLAGWLTPLAWVVWGVGFLILALGAVALQVLISLKRRAATP